MPERRGYGLWESPVTGAALASGVRLRGPSWDSDGRTLGWFEGRADRGVVVVAEPPGPALQADTSTRDLSGDISVRADIGYGGGDFTLANGHLFFVGADDQRIYRRPLGGGPAEAITPSFGQVAAPTVSPDGRWLAYVHSYEGEDSIAVVDSAGESWPQRLARGRDFVMQPAWSPDGRRLAWVEWDHPNMPWEGTEVRVAELSFHAAGVPAVSTSEVVAGGRDEALLQPTFTADGDALLYVSDASGWGHLCHHDLATGKRRPLTDGACEFGTPAWGQGVGVFAVLPSGRIVAVRQRRGFAQLVEIDGRGELHELPVPAEYAAFAGPVASPTDDGVAVLASGPATPTRLLTLDLSASGAGGAVIIQRSAPGTLTPADLSRPEPVSWSTTGGTEIQGLYSAPTNPRYVSEGPPPLVVVAHGGPTDQADASWRPQVQFLTSRGYAVLAVNYRGSSGAGREAMLALRGEWGVVDVEDCRSGAEAMVARGLADPARLIVMGGSAGGYTALRSLQVHPGFYRAGVSLYGISNLFTLASGTHKFEAHYLDSLVGPLPGAAALYRERSPIFHADQIVDPIALFQGDEDRVVPREQSDAIAASLRARGVAHEYHVYEGEGHGWRKPETIEAFYTALERFLQQYVVYA